jgi:hypothetical protein
MVELKCECGKVILATTSSQAAWLLSVHQNSKKHLQWIKNNKHKSSLGILGEDLVENWKKENSKKGE